MATASSNFGQISLILGELANAVDFRRPGRESSLGKDLLGIIATGIVDRSITKQAGPDGSRWAPNKEPYASSPRKAGKPVGVLSGEMLSLTNVAGVQTIAAHEVTMEYGIDAGIKERLSWFEAGRSGSQEPRPVYGVDPEIEAAIGREIEDAVEQFVRDLD